MEMIKKSMKDICTSMYQGINTVADKVEYLTQGKPSIFLSVKTLLHLLHLIDKFKIPA